MWVVAVARVRPSVLKTPKNFVKRLFQRVQRNLLNLRRTVTIIPILARFHRMYCRNVLLGKIYCSLVHSFLLAVHSTIVPIFGRVELLFILFIDASPVTGNKSAMVCCGPVLLYRPLVCSRINVPHTVKWLLRQFVRRSAQRHIFLFLCRFCESYWAHFL